MGNFNGEIMSFLDGGKYFLLAQKLANVLGSPHCSEHVTAAKQACDLAVKVSKTTDTVA